MDKLQLLNGTSANGPMALQNKRALWLLVVWLAGGVRLANAEGVLNYTVTDWPAAGLGNARVRLAVSNNAEIVYAHVPWRRRDAEPERKATLLVDAATGKQLTNVIRIKVSRESGDFLFQPPTVPGEYYLYFLPFRSVGEWYFPTTLYLAPTNTADAAWTASCAPAMERIKEGKPAGVPTARVLELQAIDDFHRFDPMEITATSEELKQFFASHGSRPYLLFPEDRWDPIRMTEDLPLRWVQAGPGGFFKGEACRGEFYAFQVGLYASRQAIEKVSVTFGDLIGTDGTRISATALRCFNLSGTNWLGQPIQKTVNVPEGKVQALWFGVAVPQEATAQTYRGTLTVWASNAPATSVALELEVSNHVLADAGESEIWRQSRLRWLDSGIGLDDEVFAPYTPVQVEDQKVALLGRSVHFNDTGLLDSIRSTFSRNVDDVAAPAQELLAAPMQLVAETTAGHLNWAGTTPRILSRSSGAVVWEARSTAGSLRLDCWAKMECDGYVNFKLTLNADQATALTNVWLEIPLRRQAAVYMMGLGCKGGYRPESWQWKWDPARANNQWWIGDVNVGLSCKLKHLQDRWDLYNLKESGPYRDWSNDGRGGCSVEEEGDQVVVRAYTGARQMLAGEALHFNFGLLITPVKVLDKRHWHWRYYHSQQAPPVAEVAKTGAKIFNMQGVALNPYGNYPFMTVDKLSTYTREAHARHIKPKIGYTVRELSDHAGEFWALRSLGNEVFADGPGFRLTDQFQAQKSGAPLLATGDSWLCEHVVSNYVPGWHTPLDHGREDNCLINTGLSR